MKSDVICMGVGRVPAGEQRSRFLAVGLSDNTVRIISLDPNVCITNKIVIFCLLSDKILKIHKKITLCLKVPKIRIKIQEL